VISGLKEDFECLGFDLQSACADFVQNRFIAVGKMNQAFEAECARATFDRMHRAEYNVDGLVVRSAVIH
jgi:hypothetical protein